MTFGTRTNLTVSSFLSEAAAAYPDKPYLYFRNKQFSYTEFAQKVSKAARAFQEMNIGAGDKVCILLPNCPEFLFAWLGLAHIGAISVFANTSLKAPEIQYIVHHSESKAIVTASQFLKSIPPRGIEQSNLRYSPICIDLPSTAEAISFQEMLQAAPADFRPPQLNPGDVVTFIYTSGTTGLPKAVMQTHQTYVLTGESIPGWLQLNSDDLLFTCLPLFHINAQAYSVMGSLGARGSLILGEKFSASSFWSQVKNSGATEFNLIGAMPNLLLKQPAQESDRDHSVRTAYTAPALSREEHEEFESRFGLVLVSGYGMSECTFGTIDRIAKDQRQLGSMGLPRFHPDSKFGINFRIVDDCGRELGVGNVGEISLKNAAVMKGYYKDPEATAAALRDGWLYTGDLAYRDEKGFIHFAGRKKDMIRLKGENVSAYEVESVINEHPGVMESAVLGLPSEFGDEKIIAAVLPKPGSNGLSQDDILNWCRARLADFKVPSIVEFRTTFPRTSTEKIAKQILREELLDKGKEKQTR
jgi:carnitine-CoA ligase